MGLFKIILKLLIDAYCVAFVVLNRQNAVFYYSPLANPIELPLWALGMVLFAVGFTGGAFMMWLNAAPQRREIRTLRKEKQKLETERDSLENSVRDNGAVKLENLGSQPEDRVHDRIY